MRKKSKTVKNSKSLERSRFKIAPFTIENPQTNPVVRFNEPAKYDPKFHPIDFVTHCREGKHRSQICVAWGIHRAILEKWVLDYPDFKDAYLRGREAFESYWYEIGLDMALTNRTCNDKIYKFLAVNTVGWGEDVKEDRRPWADAETDDLEFILE